MLCIRCSPGETMHRFHTKAQHGKILPPGNIIRFYRTMAHSSRIRHLSVSTDIFVLGTVNAMAWDAW
jgi:hypothetical protein